MNQTEILDALREFTARERIDFLPPAPEARPVSDYAPIQKYVLDLKNGAKPETAAEDLFTALCKEVLGFQPTRQVGSGEGWVDFMLPEPQGRAVAVGTQTALSTRRPGRPLASRRQPEAARRPDQEIPARPRILDFDRPAHGLVFQRPRLFL